MSRGNRSTGSAGPVPYGGTFDPATGAWGRLPNAPEELTGRWQAYAISGPQVASDGYLHDDANETWTRIERPEGAPERPGAAVWAGDELIVFGGFSDDDGYVVEGLSNQAFRDGRSAAPDTGPVLVPGGSVAVVLQDGTLGHVDGSGQVEQLAQLPDDVGEPDAVAVDPSGRVVLVSAVSSDDDDASVCQATATRFSLCPVRGAACAPGATAAARGSPSRRAGCCGGTAARFVGWWRTRCCRRADLSRI